MENLPSQPHHGQKLAPKDVVAPCPLKKATAKAKRQPPGNLAKLLKAPAKPPNKKKLLKREATEKKNGKREVLKSAENPSHLVMRTYDAIRLVQHEYQQQWNRCSTRGVNKTLQAAVCALFELREEAKNRPFEHDVATMIASFEGIYEKDQFKPAPAPVDFNKLAKQQLKALDIMEVALKKALADEETAVAKESERVDGLTGNGLQDSAKHNDKVGGLTETGLQEAGHKADSDSENPNSKVASGDAALLLDVATKADSSLEDINFKVTPEGTNFDVAPETEEETGSGSEDSNPSQSESDNSDLRPGEGSRVQVSCQSSTDGGLAPKKAKQEEAEEEDKPLRLIQPEDIEFLQTKAMAFRAADHETGPFKVNRGAVVPGGRMKALKRRFRRVYAQGIAIQLGRGCWGGGGGVWHGISGDPGELDVNMEAKHLVIQETEGSTGKRMKMEDSNVFIHVDALTKLEPATTTNLKRPRAPCGALDQELVCFFRGKGLGIDTRMWWTRIPELHPDAATMNYSFLVALITTMRNNASCRAHTFLTKGEAGGEPTALYKKYQLTGLSGPQCMKSSADDPDVPDREPGYMSCGCDELPALFEWIMWKTGYIVATLCDDDGDKDRLSEGWHGMHRKILEKEALEKRTAFGLATATFEKERKAENVAMKRKIWQHADEEEKKKEKRRARNAAAASSSKSFSSSGL
ncbi:hypothetical protein C8J56DRAFT_892599 [Mycena floridula]|nr:hypothetical protein C8J56DRAFT_892599 [Mycena floridula]